MRQIRITGLVRVADEVRRDLADPTPSIPREHVLARVRQAIGQVDSILHQHGLQSANLPNPSRRAYAFLRQLATDPEAQISDSTAQIPSPAPPPRFERHPARAESIRFNGLSSFLAHLLDNIAIALNERRLNHDAMLRQVQNTCQRLDRDVASQDVQAAQLKSASRDLLAWFRWMARPEQFAAYVEAVESARCVLGELAAPRLRWPLPLLVHFQPTGIRLYSWRMARSGTRLLLPTPMMSFGAEQFAVLGRWMCGDKSARQGIIDWVHAEPYLALAGQIQATVGKVERTGGITHDLMASFDRVNREYFAGAMPRPRLIWSRSLTGRLFGTYRAGTDTVCVSSTLDQPHVPTFVVDHVIHHELLHKKHGAEWHGRRQHVHTPAFRTEERQFHEYAQADALLKKLAREHG